MPLTLKKLISRVRPGVLLTRANFFRCTSRLSSDDLPTFERPAKATSGRVGSGRHPPAARHAADELERTDDERFVGPSADDISAARPRERPSRNRCATSASASTSSIVFTGWKVIADAHLLRQLLDVARVLLRNQHVANGVSVRRDRLLLESADAAARGRAA